MTHRLDSKKSRYSPIQFGRPGGTFSFELFPPKTEYGLTMAWQTIRELECLRPTFVSVTYGAGGSSREHTHSLTSQIASETSLLPVAHLTCVNSSTDELRQIIGEYAASGVRTILALRGDPPVQTSGSENWEPHPNGLRYAAELVTLIKSLGNFQIGVAAFPEIHPESASLDQDARNLAHKQECGASFAITQFFFDKSDYINLVVRAEKFGCTMPIIPGIMPIENLSQLQRLAKLCGAQIPEKFVQQFGGLANDEVGLRELGIEMATELCGELLDHGAPGLHFYTLNKSDATRRVYQNLGLST